MDSLRETVAQTKVEMLSFKRGQAPLDVARLLQMDADAKSVHVVRLRSMQGVPVMVTDAWLPLAVGSHLTGSMLRKQPLYEILLAEGVTFGRVVQETSATLADPIIAAHLAIPVGSPALRLVRLMHDLDDRPLLHLTVHAAAERSRILMEVPASAVNTLPTGHLVHEVSPRAARRGVGSKG
jgi:GntR family transcriptional regulator